MNLTDIVWQLREARLESINRSINGSPRKTYQGIITYFAYSLRTQCTLSVPTCQLLCLPACGMRWSLIRDSEIRKHPCTISNICYYSALWIIHVFMFIPFLLRWCLSRFTLSTAFVSFNKREARQDRTRNTRNTTRIQCCTRHIQTRKFATHL